MNAQSMVSVPGAAASTVDAGRVSERPWNLRAWGPAIILSLLVVLQCTRALPRLDDTLLHEDSGQYMLLARSLASGNGYRQLSAPGEPPHVLFPPAFPAGLAALRLAGADSASAAKTLVLLLGLSVVPVTYLLLQPVGGTTIALLVAAWVSLHPDYIRSATTLCADAPYLAISLIALLAIRASAKRPGWRDGSGTIAWLATVTAALTRAVGLPLMAIAPIYLAWHKARPRWSARIIACGLLSVAYAGPPVAWEAWKAMNASEQVGGYTKLLQLRNEYDWDAGTVTGVGDIARRFVRNTRRHVRGLGGIIVNAGTDRQRSLLGLSLLALIMGGIVLQIRRGHYLVELYLVLAAIATVAHPAPQLPRYLVPMLPFLLFYPAVLIGALGRHGHQLAVVSLVLCIVTAVGTHDVNARESNLRLGYGEYHATAQWLATHTAPNSVVLCRKPALMYWWSGRKSVAFPLSRELALMDDRVERYQVTHVVEDSFSDRTPLFLHPWLAARSDRSTLSHTHGATRVWRLNSGQASSRYR